MAVADKTRPFLRSSERRVVDPNEALVVKADRRRNKALQAFEEIGFSSAAASVLVTRTPITDESAYDLEGVVRP